MAKKGAPFGNDNAKGRHKLDKLTASTVGIGSVGLPFAIRGANTLLPISRVGSMAPIGSAIGGAFQGYNNHSLSKRTAKSAALTAGALGFVVGSVSSTPVGGLLVGATAAATNYAASRAGSYVGNKIATRKRKR